jgi:hypothetical protein
MKKRLVHSFAFLVLLSGSWAAAQVSQSQYSADMIIRSQNGDMNAKFFYSPVKTRMDMQTPGGAVSTITDVPSRKVFMVMHDRRM